MKTKIHLVFFFRSTMLLLFIALISSCKKDEEVIIHSQQVKTYDAQLVLDWYQLLVEIDRYAPNYRPPAAARFMAYLGLAGYESVISGMENYNSLKSRFPGLQLPKVDENTVYYWPATLNKTYASMFRYFYPHIKLSDINRINALETKWHDLFETETNNDVLIQSENYGIEVSDAIYEFSKTDEWGHDAYKNPRPSSYIPPKFGPEGEKLWQPTWPDYTPALFPYWGKVRPFTLTQGDLISKPPLAYSTNPNSKFFQQAMETKTWVDNATLEDKWIAEFWSDDFYEVTFEPAARIIAIANQIVKENGTKMDLALELYAKLGMSMCDASIAIWNSKYIYNVQRPIEFIRENIDPQWTTLLNHPYNNIKSITPEFPAYPSGHSGFGGAGTMILTDIFGNNYAFTDNCHLGRHEFLSTPRSYTSFLEAGIEDAYSRIPLGVHYRMDCDEGLRLGYLAASKVIDLPWRR